MTPRLPLRRLGLAAAVSLAAGCLVAAFADDPGPRPREAAASHPAAALQAKPAQAAPRFGGSYSGLDERRQRLIEDVVARFNKVSGQTVEPAYFYDTFITFSAKTTFDAVTHALITTALTDGSGVSLGDALSLVARVDTVRGQVPGGASDGQFRMYVILAEGARDRLERSQQFKRGRDNTVYHKGFPVSYREQGGVPSIQISMSPDGRRADIDVDYRAPTFPAAVFNGHLTSANSDVRAGDNYDRHVNRWTGFQNWWRGFFGIRFDRAAPDTVKDDSYVMPARPRAGVRPIDVMVQDFLQAWLVEGDVAAAMGYVSERAYACLAESLDDPLAFDRGMAPLQLMMQMKAAHEALGKPKSLEGAIVGVRFAIPAVKAVSHPNHARYVLYAVPDDVAARFDCERRLQPGTASKAQRVYGNYFGSVFHAAGAKGRTVALLWGKEKGYWKVVGWQTDADEEEKLPAPAAPRVEVTRVAADASLAEAARGFLDQWLVRKNYDAAFAFLAPESYGCYNASRNPGAPAAPSVEAAGPLIRAGLERAGKAAGAVAQLATVVAAAEPVHPAVRVMDHPASRTFTLVGYPDDVNVAAGCAGAVDRSRVEAAGELKYGTVFGMNVRFVTAAGEGPVMRTLWAQGPGGWRITAYFIEYP